MTREEVKKLLPIIQAYAEGKAIQIKKEGDWLEVGKNTEVYFSESPSDYRIKPEPKYRPFRTQEECWQEMLKHHPFGWIRDNYSTTYKNITVVHDVKIELTPYYTYNGEDLQEIILYSDAIKRYTFVDGTPFGIKEE